MHQKHVSEEQRERDLIVTRESQREMDYISTMSQVTQIMQDEWYFKEGLQILELGLQLVSIENVLIFLKRAGSPIRLIVQKIHGTSATTEECIKAIQFFTSLARIEEGADFIVRENIVQVLATCPLLQKVNSEELYIEVKEGARNPTHIAWCSFLLFLRTLNSQYVNDSDFKPQIS